MFEPIPLLGLGYRFYPRYAGIGILIGPDLRQVDSNSDSTSSERYGMVDKPEKSVQVQPVNKPTDQPAWYDSFIKIVQELLNFNMLTYKKEKSPRL